MTGTLIKKGRVIDPQSQRDNVADLYINEGVIVGIGAAPEGFTAAHVIDAEGAIVAPGLVDLVSHLHEPGQERTATIESETRAAAKAGITTVCCLPDNGPIIDSPSVVELILQRARHAGFARVLPLGALTQGLRGEQPTEMTALRKAGCVGFTQGGVPLINSEILRHCFAYAATFDIPIFIEPEDFWLSQQGCMHEGPISMRLGLTGIPASAEALEISRCLHLMAESGVRIHFSKLSTAAGVALIREAKQRQLPVSASVTAHHLFLTEMDVSDFNTHCRVKPPLRSLHDQEALKKGLQDGTIDCICSDHTPHGEDAKQVPFDQAAPGISSFETLLPLVCHLQDNGSLSLPYLLAKVTANPAQILGASTGTLALGAPADICIFSAHEYSQVDPLTWWSRSKNTPFTGWDLPGKVLYTLLAGQVVYQH